MSNENELNELLAAFIDDELTEEQRRRLAEIVQYDADARARFLEHCRMHAALAWEHGVLGNLSFSTAPEANAENVVEVSFGTALADRWRSRRESHWSSASSGRRHSRQCVAMRG